MPNNKYRVPSLDKALDILEHVSQAIDPLSFSMLCKELGKSPNELFRVVNCLERRGYLLKDEKNHSLTLSLKLYELAHYHPPLQKLLHGASGPMAEFGETTGLSSHLSVIEKGDMINLYEQEGTDPIAIHVKMGSRFPAVKSNSGRFLIALLEEDRLQAFLKHDPTFQAFSATEKNKMLRELQTLKKKSYMLRPSVTTPGLSDAIVPLGKTDGALRATFAVPFFKKITNPDELIEKMLATAQQINRKLGIVHSR